VTELVIFPPKTLCHSEIDEPAAGRVFGAEEKAQEGAA